MMRSNPRLNFRYYDFFLTAYIVILMAVLTVYSKFLMVENLFGFNHVADLINSISPFQLAAAIPAVALPFALTYPLCDVVAEVYGPKPAKRLMMCGIVAELFFAFMVLKIIRIPSKEVLVPNEYFQVAHGSIMLYAISNIIGTIVGKTTNIYIISKLKLKYLGRAFCKRSLISTTAGELLLSLVAATISFGQNLPMRQVVTVAVTCFLFKIMVAVVLVKPIQWISAVLKHLEGVDVYDQNTNMNPFDIFAPDKKAASVQ